MCYGFLHRNLAFPEWIFLFYKLLTTDSKWSEQQVESEVSQVK